MMVNGSGLSGFMLVHIASFKKMLANSIRGLAFGWDLKFDRDGRLNKKNGRS